MNIIEWKGTLLERAVRMQWSMGLKELHVLLPKRAPGMHSCDLLPGTDVTVAMSMAHDCEGLQP